MNEIEKMYKNAGVKPICDGLDCWTCIAKCNNGKYPEFTAEKQIELIKEIYLGYPLQYASGNYDNLSFEEGLAYRINNSWEDLMEKQKQQIKEILE
jgi:hypothetical protein